MHQEAITRAAIRNINISQRRNEREKPLPVIVSESDRASEQWPPSIMLHSLVGRCNSFRLTIL